MSAVASDQAAEAWKQHVSQCSFCANANTVVQLCPIGRNFWPQQPAQPQPSPQSQEMTTVDQRTANQIADQVADRIMARSSSGAMVGVPMEKTSVGVAVRTSRDVVLRIPERDINIYGSMKATMVAVLKCAEEMGKLMTVDAETRRVIRTCRELAVDLQGEIERRLGT